MKMCAKEIYQGTGELRELGSRNGACYLWSPSLLLALHAGIPRKAVLIVFSPTMPNMPL